jgi:caa(3)-type oxidase subunit IV
MSDVHSSEHGHADHGPNVAAYLAVFGALSVFTFVSFIANWMAGSGYISKFASFLVILGVAIVKAALVGWIFMHLKFDWRKLYFLIVPAFILGAMMMIVLMPDIVLAWWK